MLKYSADDCSAAIAGFTNYLGRFPDGAYVLDARYNRATCFQKNKDFSNALQDYSFVHGKGLNRYYEKATLEAARISYFELKDFASSKNILRPYCPMA